MLNCRAMSNFSRRGFLQATALGATAAPLAAATPPNVLFVLADQWRASAFGFGSDAVVRTPNFDALAKQAANWRRAYAANPVCTPNRASILTGRYSHQTGMIKNDIQLPPTEVCWPEAFAEAGYATHYIGKWHLDGPPKPGYIPPGWRRRGFQTFEGFNRGHVYHEHWGFEDDGRPLAKRAESQLDPYYEPTLQTDLALEFMGKHKDDPFVCFLSWGPPHTPFRPPSAFDLYSAGEIQLRENVPSEHHKQAVKDLVGYYGLCESLDHEMGRLVKFLDDNGLAENTLVVFTSDHGELAGSHGKYRKGEPEDESLHVPLLIRLPGRIAEQETQTLINSIDLMPTMMSLCGLSEPATCTGSDLSGAVLGDAKAPSVESLYCEGKVNAPTAGKTGNSSQQTPWRALVTERYKLAARVDFGEVDGLFDLQEDPFELRNLAGKPEHKRLEEELVAELRDWGKRSDDSFPKTPAMAREEYSDAEAAAAQ